MHNNAEQIETTTNCAYPCPVADLGAVEPGVAEPGLAEAGLAVAFVGLVGWGLVLDLVVIQQVD